MSGDPTRTRISVHTAEQANLFRHSMEAAIAQLTEPSVQESSTARGSQQRRHRQGRGQGRGRGAALSFRPASVAPGATNSSGTQPDAAASVEPPSRRRPTRGRGGNRGRGGSAVENRVVNGRTFGGQLTRTDSLNSEQVQNANPLQGDATVFVPGQQQPAGRTSRVKQPRQPRQSLPAKKKLPKSEAPDIATRTHEDIDNGHYECPICTSDVQRNSKVWSCHTCWTVFHLTCVKKWATNAGASLTQSEPQNGELPPLRQWRCPGCNLPKGTLPGAYTCWCEKEIDPRSPAGLPPHSCGQTCAKERARKCPHHCQLTCHAGPCPPCTHMGPTQSCFCGKHETTKRCSETNYESGWSCGDPCNTLLKCGEHRCPLPCHDGPCSPCDVRLPARCYCGQTEKDVLCSDRGEPKISFQDHGNDDGAMFTESWTGMFDCGNSCGRKFDCGVHACEQVCHPQKKTAGHCPRSPDVVTHCSCGKTHLAEITDQLRQTCEDPIPSCQKPCEKWLSCGHTCPRICHTGNCPPCRRTVTINCRCGRTTSNTICHQGQEEQPQCMRICRANLNCGRHACEERCCTGERKAVERLSTKRRQRPLGSAQTNINDGIEAEHICTRQCGRLLKCGTHHCEELCHKGPCGTCREAIFEEIACACGRTVLQPPLPCGTGPPPCRFPCERPKACGHPQVAHNCHGDSEQCPRCPFLVQRRCLCGKKILRNQQCWFRDVRCGDICGKKLRCGVHFCQKPCHRAGDCEDSHGQSCSQPCGARKKICGHPDEAPCHAPYACEEDKPCPSKTFITCECQAQKQEVKCGASKSSEGNLGKTLPCNDECAKLERNRKLALALNIDQSTHVEGGDHIPFSTETLNLYAQFPKWGQTQEREFRVFAAADDEKRLRFKPMQPQQRSFIHSLADDFGLDSESVDPEPHRHVMVWKTPRFVSAPHKTLADALRIRRQAQKSVNASATASDTEGTNVPKARIKITQPFNSYVIKKPRFGLTIDEIRNEVASVMHHSTPFAFEIEFLPSDEVVLRVISQSLPPHDIERLLMNLKTPLATAVALKGIGSLQLCTTDTSLNITRLESDATGGDGWSRVAAKKAAPRTNLQANSFGASNPFAALSGGKVTFAKKKPEKAIAKPEPVVDDWEAAELEEEEKERLASASEEQAHIPADASVDDRVDDQPRYVSDVPTLQLGQTSEHRDWASDHEDTVAGA